MVFQPTSPIKTFHRALKRANSDQHTVTARSSGNMPLSATSTKLEKLRLKKRASKPDPAMMSKFDRTDNLTSLSSTNVVHDTNNTSTHRQSTVHVPMMPVIEEIRENTEGPAREAAESTSSSPVDPAYVPNQSGTGGRLLQLRSPAEPRRCPDTAEVQQKNHGNQSFFDTSSESEEDEPIIGRAQSVRISKPSMVRSTDYRESVGTLCNTASGMSDQSASPICRRISEAAEPTIAEITSCESEEKNEGPEEALKTLEGIKRHSHIPTELAQTVLSPPDLASRSPEKGRVDGLHMHPISKNGQEGHPQQSMLPFSLPQRSLTNRRVKIRPSDLVVIHPRDNTRPFRETLVSTPYPKLSTDEKRAYQEDVDEEVTVLPHRSSTLMSARFDNDRFPSPDRSEILFLELSLAGHPAISTILEIRIEDKNTYDDEMLFRRIRRAYWNQLLGASRLPFSLIRRLSHATVSPSLQYDFRVKEFMRHLSSPRLGRKRKTWVIWLRHHSQQQSPAQSHRPDSAKRPLSASLRTADKRLSMHSDSTSTLNFSFLHALTLPRIPFLAKRTATPSATTHHLPPMSDPDDGFGAIKLELHHQFSFWTLALLYFWIMIWSIAAVVLWVVFGVPGNRPGKETAIITTTGFTNGLSWNAAAQTRVLTGLVLGMTVAMLGSMAEIGLISGAYVLL